MDSTQQLEDLTNGPQALYLPSPIIHAKQTSDQRKDNSHRILRLHHLDSSETFPSEHASIYDAERVMFEKQEGEEASGSDDEQDLNNTLPHLPRAPSSDENSASPHVHRLSTAETSLQALNIHFGTDSRWHATRLDTIAERLSQRISMPLSRVMSSINSADNLIRVDDAAGSKPESRYRRGQDRKSQYACHQRSFSLNDLDCLKSRFVSHFHQSSSSSGDVPHVACSCDAYPVQPREPPPVRVPTPEGLPRFGTREAMEFRMPPLESRRWISPWRVASRVHPDPLEIPTNTLRATNACENEALSSEPTSLSDSFKRILGINRVVSPIPDLPRTAAMPLYLARADDGTFVRGRFGARHSAHGIGRGQLDNHPFHRESGERVGIRRTSLEREIRDIDKACAEVERQRMASPSLQVNNIAQASGSTFPRTEVQQLTIAEILAQPPPNTLISPEIVQHPIDRATRPQPSLTFSQMGSGGSLRSGSTTIDGVRQFVEQGERVCLEQNRELTKKKQERGKCANCWFGFWICWCDLEDPDHDVVGASRVMSPERGVSTLPSPETRPLRIVYEQPSRAQRIVFR